MLHEWASEGRLVSVCPEHEGGLSTPRPPAEIVGTGSGRAVVGGLAIVRTAAGADVTADYCAGANRALELVKEHRIRLAVLKDGSPSCGSSIVHDGTFSGTRIPGTGVTTALLESHGVRVFSERNLDRALDYVRELEGAGTEGTEETETEGTEGTETERTEETVSTRRNGATEDERRRH